MKAQWSRSMPGWLYLLKPSLLKHALGWALAALVPVTASASDHDFNAAAGSIERAFQMQRRHLPLIGLMSFSAEAATGGAVKGIRIAEFDGEPSFSGKTELPAVVQQALGASWSLILTSVALPAQGRQGEHAAEQQQTAIYARPHGKRMVLLVASYDRGEMSLVRMEMNAAHFAKWLQTPGRRVQPEITD